MEQTTARLEYKVGLFVGLALLTVMISVLLLGGDRIVFTRHMTLKTQFEEVQGLFPGSIVSLAGMPIGNIKKIYFAADSSKLEIEMQVDMKHAPRITEGTTADIRTQGALGDKFVYLKPGPPDAAPLASGAMIVADTSGDIFKMLTSKEDGVGRVLDLVKEVRILVASLNNNGRTAQMMDNLVQVSAHFKATLTKLDVLLGDLKDEIPNNAKLRNAAASLANILEKVDQGKGTLGALINDPSLHQNLKSFLGGSGRNRYVKDMVRETIQQNEAAK